MTTQSQSKAILEALQAGETLTPMDALRRFDCFRLGARIHDLVHGTYDGTEYDIETEMVKLNGKRFARYKLRKSATLPEPAPKRTIIHINCDGTGDCPYPLAHAKPKVESTQMLF